MRTLIITDIHYGEDTNYPKHGGEDYINSFGSQFKNFLPKIRELAKRDDLLVNLGDLFKDVNPEQDLRQYKEAIGLLQFGIPIANVIGNHEANNLTREQIAQVWQKDKCYYSFNLGGYHHIVLDAFREAKGEPYFIYPEQLAWLKEDLERTPLSTLIYCHVPLDEQSLDDNYYFKGHPERALVSNRQEVRSILEQSNKVLAVFSGHTHFYNQSEIAGIKYFNVPAFTENDGKHQSKAECLSVDLEGDNIIVRIEKLI